jgi:hypothetical protein
VGLRRLQQLLQGAVTKTDPAGFSTSTSPAGPGFAGLIDASLDRADGWRIDAGQSWVHVNHAGTSTPAQGWKLHVSSTTAQGDDVLRVALPVLVAEAVTFKAAASLERLDALNRGQAGASQVGKFLTVYPTDDDQAVRLAAALDVVTRGLVGPRVRTDRPLRPGSLVSYRYGSFDHRWMQTPIGEVVPALEAPDGSLVPDTRNTFYIGPAGVADPFEAAGVVEATGPVSLIVGDRYLLAAVLSSTPESSVHLALDLVTGVRCVVKRVRDGAKGNPVPPAAQRLQHEGQVLNLLSDEPAVPDLYGRLDHDDDSFLVMELVRGTSFEELVATQVATGQPLPLDRVLAYARAIASTVGRLHARGFVHGDLKPPDLFATDDGIRLVDVESLQRPDDDLVHQVIGTPGYASPQRFDGAPLCVADDVHSFGGLLYLLLTGADPSYSPDRNHVLGRPIALLRPDTPAPLTDLVRRCLQRDPTARPSSMDEMVAELDRARNVTDGGSLRLPEEMDPAWVGSLARDLASELCRRAVPVGDGLVWPPESPGQPVLRDLALGVAGIVLVLAEVAPILDDDRLFETLAGGARWLAASRPLAGGPLPGLYVGEAGIATALLYAGLASNDDDLVADALERRRLVADLPHVSPDLYNGTAGRVRSHLLTWQLGGDDADRVLALAAADELADRAELTADGTLAWTIPAGYEGPEPRQYLGYAHGLAGIADVLVDVVELTGESRYLPLVEAARTTLVGAVRPGNDGVPGLPIWTDRPDGREVLPLWCHGAGGIAHFLHRAGRILGDESSLTLSGQARRAAAAVRTVGASQCHGLAGTIELLLDAPEDPAAQRQAAELAHLLACFVTPPDELDPPSPLALREDGLMTGKAGVLRCLVRLARPNRLGPLLDPTRAGPSVRRGS